MSFVGTVRHPSAPPSGRSEEGAEGRDLAKKAYEAAAAVATLRPIISDRPPAAALLVERPMAPDATVIVSPSLAPTWKDSPFENTAVPLNLVSVMIELISLPICWTSAVIDC